MRHFSKGPEPDSLRQYREDGGHYRNLRTEIKDEIRERGVAEQGGLCAFCCGVLPNHRAKQIIAHLVPRDARTGDPALALSYENMVISCTGGGPSDDVAGEPGDHSCDRRQRNIPLPITPVQQNCQSRFLYDANGGIRQAAGDDDAMHTIMVLGLGCRRLNKARLAAYEEAEKYLDEIGEEAFRREVLSVPRCPLASFLPMLEALLG